MQRKERTRAQETAPSEVVPLHTLAFVARLRVWRARFQVFFHDPDHNMIEICNCDCLPVVPLPTPWMPRDQSSSCSAAINATDSFCIMSRTRKNPELES